MTYQLLDKSNNVVASSSEQKPDHVLFRDVAGETVVAIKSEDGTFPFKAYEEITPNGGDICVFFDVMRNRSRLETSH